MRLIDGDALKEDLRESYERLREIYNGLTHDEDRQICAGQLTTFTEAILRIKDAPTIEAEPVRHGIWTTMVHTDTGEFAGYKCSECGIVEYRNYDRCRCGAIMDGGSEE